jgi:hypothetical protein
MKIQIKLIGIIALVAVIGFSMLACDFGGNDDSKGGNGVNPTIHIKNNTGNTFLMGLGGSLFIKPDTEAGSWGSGNYRIGYAFNDGETFDITLSQPLSVHKVYDFRLTGSGDFRKYGVTVSNGMTITFTTNDLNDGSADPKITIQNRSGKTFDSIHIKPSVSSDWSESSGWVGNNSDRDVTILIPPSNYTVFDIQMRSTNPTNTYTRSNITVSNGMTLLFTSADADSQTIELPVIVIQNNTGYAIEYGMFTFRMGIWIRPSTEEGWGDGLYMGSWTPNIDDGTSRAFSLSQHLSTQNIYDIRIKAGEHYFAKYNVTVTEGMIITFTTSDFEQ